MSLAFRIPRRSYLASSLRPPLPTATCELPLPRPVCRQTSPRAQRHTRLWPVRIRSSISGTCSSEEVYQSTSTVVP